MGISRQSIDNWLDICHQYGDAVLQNSSHIPGVNKARELELHRKVERDERQVDRKQVDGE